MQQMMTTRRNVLGATGMGLGGLSGRVRAQTTSTLKVGVLTDMSGILKDVGGPTAVACAHQAVEDFERAGAATAVRELDMHDTSLAADYSHPGDNIPPMLAVAQSVGKSGQNLLRGVATGYDIHIDLVRAISQPIGELFALVRRRGDALRWRVFG